jgi:hypothetical protein
MSGEQQQLFMMRGVIASMSEDDQRKITETAKLLRDIVGNNKEVGTIALALVGAELSVQS